MFAFRSSAVTAQACEDGRNCARIRSGVSEYETIKNELRTVTSVLNPKLVVFYVILYYGPIRLQYRNRIYPINLILQEPKAQTNWPFFENANKKNVTVSRQANNSSATKCNVTRVLSKSR